VPKSDIDGHRPGRQGDADTNVSAPPAGGSLTRVTVNLTPRSVSALERTTRITGDSKTDTINRALQIYALVHEMAERDNGSLRIVHEDGETERIHLL
jgi:hypothetical protein